MIKRQVGVKTVEYDLNTGVATLTYPSGLAFELKALRQAIKRAGFNSTRVELNITGTLLRLAASGGPAIKVSSTGQTFSIHASSEERSRNSLKQVGQLLATPDRKVVVYARLQGEANTELKLDILSVSSE